jgi:hypothetical protein
MWTSVGGGNNGKSLFSSRQVPSVLHQWKDTLSAEQIVKIESEALYDSALNTL